jgi:hypothetical protein
MTKGEECIDRFMGLAKQFHQGSNLTPSQYFENYKIQENFFETIYREGWQAGVEDSNQVNKSFDLRKQ